MPNLKDALAERIPVLREETQQLVGKHGNHPLSEVTLAQAYGGMRGVIALVCDTSMVDPHEGLKIRGHPIGELTDRSPEEIFYLLCVGHLPDADDTRHLQNQLTDQMRVPDHVIKVLQTLPGDAHPMNMLITGVTCLEEDSIFRARYDQGLGKDDFWEATLEDALQLLAQLPELAAAVYRIRFGKGPVIPPDPSLDWASNFAHMLGNDSSAFADLMRLYLVLHSDHEGGNLSTFAARVVGSALSDPYFSVAAGLSGLSGPLHGLANQEGLTFVLGLLERFGGRPPTPEQMEAFTWELIESGRVVPGYGHAVLRATDPRFIALHDFGSRLFPEDPVFNTVDVGYRVIPRVLTEHGKAKNPWPNVDAVSGAVLHHFGITEMTYYTVFFAVSRAMGILSQLIMARGIGEPITRPKSVTTDWIRSQVKHS
jgi:citrate synthase